MILTTLLNIAIFQGIVLGGIILKSPLFKSSANKYLAFAFFSLSISLLNYVLDDIGVYKNIPFLRFIDIIDSGILFPVFIFLYVINQINHPIKNSKKVIWLFVPYLYATIFSVLDELDTISTFDSPFSFMLLFLEITHILLIVFFIPGILLCTYVFVRYSNNIQEKKWLTYLWLLTFIIMISFVLSIILALLFDFDITSIMRALAVLSTFLIHWTAYYGIFKFRLARDQEEIKALMNRKNPVKKNLVATEITLPKVSDDKKEETFTKENIYFKKLEDLCVNHHIYRDSTLDRDKVAEMLGISTGYVSQLINIITGNNFATYINHYRVQEVKDIILNTDFDNYSLLAIGLECGFSSKSTFHNAFKKITGITPNAYRKKYK
ncbi:helix-turn-helix domain-containing protein [Aquimarina aquimarini]|uniref:helix-turn-helix domain-containing protein n=1 Tax=Aquimarina aquimarini TaxID=1191734 RepID=UPI000D559AC9|nr:AraC family transcriptional regulator [Aquimarina aquimarini]